MKIVDYYTVEATNSVRLDEMVREHMRDGWQPFGGVAVATLERREYNDERYRDLFCQAMVKYEEATDDRP